MLKLDIECFDNLAIDIYQLTLALNFKQKNTEGPIPGVLETCPNQRPMAK